MVTPLFWQESFVRLNPKFSRQEIVLKSKFKERTLLFNFTMDEAKNKLDIPGQLTFGGLWPIDREQLNLEDVYQAFNKISDNLPNFEISKIKMPPSYFYPEIFNQQNHYFKSLRNFVSVIEVNQTVFLSDWDTSKLRRDKIKKIKKFEAANGLCDLARETELGRCIDILEENRINKGLRLSLSKSEILNLLRLLPNNYKMYKVEIENRICASALTVSLSDTVEYVLYWGDDENYRALSPVTSLFLKIVTSCKSGNKRYLDLGISSVNGNLEEGLFNFKSSLGASAFSKYHFKLLKDM